MKKPLYLTLTGLLVASNLYATTTDTTDFKRNDFANDYLEPFEEDQGYTGDDVLDEGFRFYTDRGNRFAQIIWKESEYDGTRRERGHEIKGQVTSDDDVFSGWQWRFPSSSNNFLSDENKETIIWQMFCWNSAGCTNWTAHMTLIGDDLKFDYRAACVSASRESVVNNLRYNTWYSFAARVSPGSSSSGGKIVIRMNEDTKLSKNIDVGFGAKNSDGSMKDAVMGVKMGIYAFDTGDYTNNEQRKIRIDRLSISDRDSGASQSTCWDRVQPWTGW